MPDRAVAPSVPQPRFQWLDTLRGFALICMASYHFMWDLSAFGYLEPDFPAVGWPKIYARTIASTFLFLAGFSLVLAHTKTIRWPKFWRRFGMIFAAAAAISALTFAGSMLFNIHQALIYFGILHIMALASLVGLVFLRAPWPLTLLLAAFFVALPNSDYFQYLQSDRFNQPWFWWTGLSTAPRGSFDFNPIFPWLGPFLFGLAVGRINPLMDWLRRNSLGTTPTRPYRMPLTFLGRHSLVFYLVHQPILIAILYLFSLAVPAPTVTPEEKYIGSCEMTCKPERGEQFCQKFCGCTLERLQQTKLLEPFQSGAISVHDDARIKDIAIECTTLSE
jgi:uncharacterized membrane protein